MKTLNELIRELLELQKQGLGEYSVIDFDAGCELTVQVNEDFQEIIFG